MLTEILLNTFVSSNRFYDHLRSFAESCRKISFFFSTLLTPPLSNRRYLAIPQMWSLRRASIVFSKLNAFRKRILNIKKTHSIRFAGFGLEKHGHPRDYDLKRMLWKRQITSCRASEIVRNYPETCFSHVWALLRWFWTIKKSQLFSL